MPEKDEDNLPKDSRAAIDTPSWPLSVKFLPVGVALFALMIALRFPALFGDLGINNLLADRSCTGTFNYTFQIARAKHHAEQLATHDWEIGTAGEAILELISPEKSVFGSDPFPRGKIPSSGLLKMDEGLAYVHERVRIDGETLAYNNYSASDPASLGVCAVMIGQKWPGWLQVAGRQKDYLLKDAPRYANGAISHRVEVAELWSDAVFMFPPFLAYYAVATQDLALMKDVVRQVVLYRDVLNIKEGKRRGLWKHIVGPSDMADDGAWSTGNGWAAYGMLRVRATIAGWPTSNNVMQSEIGALDGYITKILDAAIETDDLKSGLLRNYLGDRTWFGETSGTALLTAAAYRMAVLLQPNGERDRILEWADRKRRAVVARADEDGVARPAVNPLKHKQRGPLDGPSPEGESFLLLMGSAWRDCVCAGVCTSAR